MGEQLQGPLKLKRDVFPRGRISIKECKWATAGCW